MRLGNKTWEVLWEYLPGRDEMIPDSDSLDFQRWPGVGWELIGQHVEATS